MASKLIAKSLVKINLTGSETEQFKENARKAKELLVSDIADSTGDKSAFFTGHNCSVPDKCGREGSWVGVDGSSFHKIFQFEI